MPQNEELVTKPYEERGCRKKKHTGLCVEQMRILPPYEVTLSTVTRIPGNRR
jgi:hypothetical protein